MKELRILVLTLISLAPYARALQFDLLATRVAEGTPLSEMSATLDFHIDSVFDATRPATLVAGPDGNPLKYHFVFNYDDLYCAMGDCEGVTYTLLTVTVCGSSATRVYNHLPYTTVIAFPTNLPSSFGPNNQPFPLCGSPVVSEVNPTSFSLSEPYPNPFNPSTRLRLGLPTADNVRLEIVDLRGRRVHTVFAGPLAAGVHDFTWNPLASASGTYFVMATGTRECDIKRLLLLK